MNDITEFLGLERDYDFDSEMVQYLENFTDYTDVKYTIYIPSKGRSKYGHTAKLLEDNGIENYFIVVEPQDYDDYLKKYGAEKLIMLPENDRGIAYARTFIKKYSSDKGENFHWQMDDDMISYRLRIDNKNKKVNPRHCFSIVEDITDKFSNVAMSGITHFAFAFSKKKAVALNHMVYGVVLVNNSVTQEWRSETNEDLDFSLQILESGWCTIAFNKVLFDTFTTGKLEGGNMLNLFADDGRKKIYENTAELWPGRFKVKKLDSDRGWTLKHIRRFYNDYKQQPKLKDTN